ncbi:MAG: hypothetical protein A3E87_08890 [Gammaproteobacteria bacterium RIFCSPHIGHO2_12_FULL_35_23]|nr:MAG: hypothetical protein A3E87_08890 [Gammaproteobacteria bacterium RIFCSPHIGHO2_12_FULL_35_23]
MQLKRHFVEAIANLLSNKLRTFLAVLGILVGTASVVAMISGGKLATRQALAQFKALGTNLLSVQINKNSNNSSSNEGMDLSTILAVKQASPQIEKIAPYTNLYVPITYEGHVINGGILGVTASMKSVMKIAMESGRFISFLDTHENFCVIGQDIYQAIKNYSVGDPIGQQINVADNYFTIIGVAKAWQANSFIYADPNNSLLVPIETSKLLSKYANIDSVIFRVNSNADIDTLQNQIKNYYSSMDPGADFYFQSAKEIIASMQKQQEILTVFLGFIGSISLLVGGIGVMNIMLVSVTERRREIGIRLAIGAKRKDIRIMFLIEAVVLSLFGGIVGVILGILISFIIAEAKHWGFTIFLLPPLIGFCVSSLAGIFFGYYPAYKASKLDPIETLRME